MGTCKPHTKWLWLIFQAHILSFSVTEEENSKARRNPEKNPEWGNHWTGISEMTKEHHHNSIQKIKMLSYKRKSEIKMIVI